MKPTCLYSTVMFRLLLAGCFLFISTTIFSQQTLRTNLFFLNADGSKTLVDGNMTIYDDIYCNCVNWEDAVKMPNAGENWGLLRNGITLSVERRNFIPDNDTAFLRMWNLQHQHFVIQVIGRNLTQTNRVGYVKDNFTKLSTPIKLDDTTYINFSVDSTITTSAQDRFSVVFEKMVPPPVEVIFKTIRLFRKDARVNVEFGVENDIAVSNYMMQRASDNINFTDVKSVLPKNLGGSQLYNADAGAWSQGDNFYRVKATNNGGKITYSGNAKLSMPLLGPGLNIYPNPVVTQQLHLQITVAHEGKYLVRAVGSDGIVYPLGSLQLFGLQVSQPVNLQTSMKPGVYRIQLIGPGNEIIVKSVTIL